MGTVLTRFAIAMACIVITTITVYVGRNGYTDNNGTPVTFLDALYFSTVSLSTTGYGDIAPATGPARLANVLIITPLRLVFLIVLVGTTLEVLTRRTREEIRARKWRNHVQDHTVIIGYGVKGRSAMSTLLDSGIPANKICVVDMSKVAIDEAVARGASGVQGDGRRDEVLLGAGINRAAAVIICAEADDTAVLITLTAKRLGPKGIPVIAAARESQNSPVLRQSGASAVIPTSDAAGRLMGLSLVSPTAGWVMEDLLDPRHGLEVVERQVNPNEVGLNPDQLNKFGEIVLAVIREDGVYRFDSPGFSTLQANERIVVISHSGKTEIPH